MTERPPGAVRIAGVNVGHVVSVSRVGNEAKVTAELDPAFAPLRADATAILRNKSLLGETYLQIIPGNPAAPRLPDGTVLPARAVPHVQLDDVLSTFDPVTRAQLRHLFAALSAGLAGRAQSLNDAVGSAAPAAANLGNVIGSLDQQRGQLQQLIANGGQVLSALGQRQGVPQAAVHAGDQVLSVTAARNHQLTAIIDELPAFLAHLTATATAADGDSALLRSAVAALQPAAPLLAPALTQTKALSPHLTTLLHALPTTIAAGKQGLPALTGILQTARPALHQLWPAGRQLLPLLQLLADEPPERIPGTHQPARHRGQRPQGMELRQPQQSSPDPGHPAGYRRAALQGARAVDVRRRLRRLAAPDRGAAVIEDLVRLSGGPDRKRPFPDSLARPLSDVLEFYVI